MYKNLSITTFLGLLAVVLGAFGAHTLKSSLSMEAMQSFETAIRYQMYHVIVLLFVNSLDKFSKRQKNTFSYLIFLGILFFSGSIYAIYLLKIPAKTIWFITPLGGLLLCLGWIYLFINFVKKVIKRQ